MVCLDCKTCKNVYTYLISLLYCLLVYLYLHIIDCVAVASDSTTRSYRVIIDYYGLPKTNTHHV